MKPRRELIVLAVLMLCPLIWVGVANARSRGKHPARSAALASMGAQPNPSLFGISTAIYDTSQAYFSRGIPTARSLGARWDHFTAGAGTGSGDYGSIDGQVRRARAQGMGVVLSVGGIRGACSLRPMPANVHACPPTTADDLRNYQAYFRRLVLHYRNVVQYYESWTEENNRSSWLPGPNPGRYAAVLSAQYSAIQSVNRRYGLNLQLLFGSPTGFSITPQTSGWIAVLPYTHSVLRALHGRRAFDGVALHAYRFPPGGYGPSVPAFDNVGGIPAARRASGPFPQYGCDVSPWCQMNWAQELSAYEQVFADNGYGQPPMWLTEFGWPGNAVANGTYFPSEAAQAADLTEAYADLMRLPFVKAALWFNLRDYQPDYQSPDPGFIYHYGLVEYGYAPKPAALAFQALAAANPGR
jgi:hypothetical protein